MFPGSLIPSHITVSGRLFGSGVVALREGSSIIAGKEKEAIKTEPLQTERTVIYLLHVPLPNTPEDVATSVHLLMCL